VCVCVCVCVCACARARARACEETQRVPHHTSREQERECRTHVLRLVVHVRTRPSCLSLDDGELHVLDLDAHQQEVDLANNHVLQMVLGLVVLKLDVQTILNPDLGRTSVIHDSQRAVDSRTSAH
jgi:hypothetical protein